MLSGRVEGGGPQNPIVGAAITFYAAGSSYAGTPSALATTSTDGNGAFTLSGYTCPPTNPGAQTYVVATGGDAGGGVNAAIALIALSGPCDGVTSSTQIVANELTTIAAEYALAQFADTSGQNIGAPASNATGLGNAVAVAQDDLADMATGAAAGFWPTAARCNTGPIPINCAALQKFDTLANILAACVDSPGPGSAACAALFVNTAASNTLSAAHAMAANPAIELPGLFGLQTTVATAPFVPFLSEQPADLRLTLDYVSAATHSETGIAIDSFGAAWVSNYYDNTIVRLGPSGAPGSAFTAGGTIMEPFGIAIDSSANVWIANHGGNDVVELDSSGNPVGGSPFTGDVTVFGPQGIAIDNLQNVWVANSFGSNVTVLDSSGNEIAGSPFSGNGISNPQFVAIDSTGDAWITNIAGSLTELNSAGSPIAGTPFGDGTLDSPRGVAIDPSGNVWVASYNTSNVAEFTAAGALVAGTPVSVGGISGPQGIAIDSAGNVWIANYYGASITELTGAAIALSPASGYQADSITLPIEIAIDASGNVWITNFSGDVSVMIGAASPVRTPMTPGPPVLP